MPASAYSSARATERGIRVESSRGTDSTSAVVTAGMLLLAVLGVATVFYEPIAAIVSPEHLAGTTEASGASVDERAPAAHAH